MTADQNTRRARPAVDPAPPYMRIVRITGGNVVEGPWHNLEPAGWAVNLVRASCGVRGRQDRYDTTEKLPAGARRCPLCRASHNQAGTS
jgi:hypothetical protein